VHDLACGGGDDDDEDDGDWEILADDPYEGVPIPDLSQLAQEQWLEAMRPLGRNDRIRAMNTLPVHRIPAAMIVLDKLVSQEDAARARARTAPPARLPCPDPPATGARRQVNFRLGPGEHARLVEASRLFAMSPTVLARVLTVRGVDRALRDARRDG
jgi:hypothetical protein